MRSTTISTRTGLSEYGGLSKGDVVPLYVDQADRPPTRPNSDLLTGRWLLLAAGDAIGRRRPPHLRLAAGRPEGMFTTGSAGLFSSPVAVWLARSRCTGTDCRAAAGWVGHSAGESRVGRPAHVQPVSEGSPRRIARAMPSRRARRANASGGTISTGHCARATQ
jgi:hypothetical protein